MKKVLLTIAVAAIATSVFAQGTVQFVLNTTGFRANVYGPDPGALALSKTGNGTGDLPAGTQVYLGARLSGSGFLAQMYGGAAGSSESSLQAALPVSSFRTGSASGLVPAGLVATLQGVAKDAASAVVQVRAWDNSSGLYPTWAEAAVAWQKGLIAAGASPLANVSAIGGDFNTPPIATSLQSFNIYFVPEPSTMALAGLGAAAMLIFRRRK